MSFYARLNHAIAAHNSLLCIGLDPVLEKLPPHIQADPHPFFAFAKEIVDRTHDLVCAFKPNSAFYEAQGAQGVQELKMTCDYLRSRYPETLIILDAKRGDIGSTNEGYVKFAYEYLLVDAITLHPYLGREANLPYLIQKDNGCIFLCRTSNPGSGEFQNAKVDGKPLYQQVAKAVVTDWNQNQNCMLVVGATYPQELAEVRKLVGSMPILVPGVGAQGGDLEATLEAGLTEKKDGLIVTVSRSIIYASPGKDFAEKAREEAKRMRDMIEEYRK